MNLPLISVMMIAYNNVQFIKAAIESVQAQTYPNWELVINDDRSTDGTYELAQKLAEKDERIRVYQNERNLKTPGNRAAAMAHIKGDFVGHLDTDDMLYPHALAMQYQYLMSHPDVALVYSDSSEIGVDGNVTSYTTSRDYEPNLSWFGWRHFGMYHMSAYRKVEGYNTKLTAGCEDGDLFMQLAERYKFARNPHVLHYHRSHSTNTSTKNHKCDSCPDRPICNYIRVWTKHAKYDITTMKPIEEADAQSK
jgi:glycosyltransferase involved in cell wall biosynthesis